MEKFEYEGFWWLPNNPEMQITGTLKFDPIKGAKLELLGTFRDLGDFDLSNPLQPKIILGLTSNGKKITLYKCVESAQRLDIPGIMRSSFYCSLVFVGNHFQREENIVFDTLSINYSRLEEWTRITGFKFDPKFNSEGHLLNYAVNYNYPKKIEIEINDIGISFDYHLRSKMDINEINLKQTIFIKIEPNQKIHFDNYQEDICYHLQNFLSLALGEAVYPLTIKGKIRAQNSRSSDETENDKELFIFYSLGKLPDLSKKIHPYSMLFSFWEISDRFGEYLGNWFAKSDNLKPVYDLYFGTLYNPSMYVEHEFLSLIQAVESYHRRSNFFSSSNNGKYLKDEDFYNGVYNKFIKAIPKDLKSDFKKSLRHKFKYIHEFSLRKRLKEILKETNDITTLLIKDNNKFIKDAVNTRNYLTHYDESIEKEAKRDLKEIYKLNLKLKFILEVCFLKEIGMSMKTISSLVSRNARYKYLKKQLNEK